MDENKNKEDIEKAKSYAPTQAMKNNAKRGLALREKWNRGSLDASQAKAEGVGSGVARARDIINGNLSLDTVKRMHSFFERHEKNYRPSKKESDGGPTAGTIAWLTWGGSAGRSWARSILRQEDLLKSLSNRSELKQVTYVAMKADSIDLHGDYTSADEVRIAKENFNKALLKKQTMSNLFHLYKTDKFDVIESYLAPADMELNGHPVSKGDWLMTLQINDDPLWEQVKKGEMVGLSIGATASVETLND